MKPEEIHKVLTSFRETQPSSKKSISYQLKEKRPCSEAAIAVTYNCGCGFRTNSEAIAVQHCKESCHQLTVGGRIIPVEEK